ncbi:MAG: hypothetical protein VX672_09645 [Planctomycetota bacterium]|nr:hypothetical protein [Planctomycetota bacterium]
MFELIDETEDPTGTSWTIQRIDPEGRLRRSVVRLAWAAYDVWTPDGTLPPSRVAEAVVAFALGRPEFDPLPDPLDAARARRVIPDADRMIGDLLRG